MSVGAPKRHMTWAGGTFRPHSYDTEYQNYINSLNWKSRTIALCNAPFRQNVCCTRSMYDNSLHIHLSMTGDTLFSSILKLNTDHLFKIPCKHVRPNRWYHSFIYFLSLPTSIWIHVFCDVTRTNNMTAEKRELFLPFRGYTCSVHAHITKRHKIAVTIGRP